jgi:hypothetical protein
MTLNTYIITVRWVTLKIQPEKLDLSLNPLGAWFRFNSSTWLVSTTQSPTELRMALKSALTAQDSFLILRVDPSDRQGFAPPDVWNWLDRNSSEVNALMRYSQSVGMPPSTR